MIFSSSVILNNPGTNRHIITVKRDEGGKGRQVHADAEHVLSRVTRESCTDA